MFTHLYFSPPLNGSVDVTLDWTLSSCHMTVDTPVYARTQTCPPLTHKHEPRASFCQTANRTAHFSSVVFFFFFSSNCLDMWVSFFFPLVFPHLGLEKNICMSSSLDHHCGFWRLFSSSRAAPCCCLIRETKAALQVCPCRTFILSKFHASY